MKREEGFIHHREKAYRISQEIMIGKFLNVHHKGFCDMVFCENILREILFFNKFLMIWVSGVIKWKNYLQNNFIFTN